MRSTSTVLNLIATRTFRNTHPKSIKVAHTPHPDMVPKGAEFTLDTVSDAELIVQLNYTGSIISAEDEASVSRLRKEIASDEKAEKTAKENAAKAEAQNIGIIQQLLAMLKAGAKA